MRNSFCSFEVCFAQSYIRSTHLYSSSQYSVSMSDLDSVLRAKEIEISQEVEINRILLCCSKDYFSILDIYPLLDPESIASRMKKIYRKKSLLIHPDKVKSKDAPAAFDVLKKAELVLSTLDDSSDEAKSRLQEKTNLLDVYKQVAEGLKVAAIDNPSLEDAARIREKVAAVLENHAKLQDIERSFNQRQDMKRQEEVKTAAKDRELKRSWESRWEKDRDDRVNLWRSYTTKVEKKKKKKKVLA